MSTLVNAVASNK